MRNNSGNIVGKTLRLARKLSISHLIVFVALFAGIAVARQLFTSALTIVSGHHARCDQIAPSKTTVTTGETFSATVKMYNYGSTTWSSAFGVFLNDPYNKWNFGGYGLSRNTPSGSTATFNLTLHAPSSAGTYQFGAEMYIAMQGPIAFACTPVNITVNAPPPPPACPAGQTGTPPNCSTPTSGGGSPPLQGSSNRNTGGGTTPATPTKDTSPPSTPADFVAKTNTANMSVQLSWTASTDNIGVQSYRLERSLDNVNNWESLSGSITETNFEDFSVSFGVHYYYRLKAVDAAGNASPHASADLVSSGFGANAHPDSDATISSEDGLVSILIPAGALEKDAFCSIVVAQDILSPIPKGYVMLGGPYNFTCRDESDSNQTFKKAPVLTGQINKQMIKGIGKVEYFGQAEGDTWKTLKISKHDKKTLADTVELDNHSVFTIMGKQKKTSVWLIIFEIFLVLAGLVVLARFVVNWLLKRRASKQYEDTLHKSRGW